MATLNQFGFVFDLNSLGVTQNDISKFCKRWNIIKMEIFGSAATGKLTESSDIDLLVEYSPSYERSLDDHIIIETEIEVLFKRKVDLITKESITSDPNPFLTESIDASVVTIYED